MKKYTQMTHDELQEACESLQSEIDELCMALASLEIADDIRDERSRSQVRINPEYRIHSDGALT